MKKIKFRCYSKPMEYMRYSAEEDPCFSSLLQDEQIEVMQYTGIDDINNKEIYEGDLVQIKDYNNWEGSYIVIWNNEYSMYMIKDKNGNNEAFYEFEKFKVIGNIYENSYLLNNIEE